MACRWPPAEPCPGRTGPSWLPLFRWPEEGTRLDANSRGRSMPFLPPLLALAPGAPLEPHLQSLQDSGYAPPGRVLIGMLQGRFLLESVRILPSVPTSK